VTGARTGAATDLDRVRAVRRAVPGTSVLVASGVTEETVAETLAAADGVVVATSLLTTGADGPRIDVEKVRRLVAAARG
jgi:predicted TIM-barrel enzyme